MHNSAYLVDLGFWSNGILFCLFFSIIFILRQMKGSIFLPINIQGHWEPEQREGQLMVEPHDPKKGMPPKNDELN